MSIEVRRRNELVIAAIEEIGVQGSLDVTVSKIAKRAGVSSALAFHYFGDKDRLFLSAMRFVLTVYATEVRKSLATADGHRGRLRALIHASFTPSNFCNTAIAAWLNFYVLAQRSPEAKRLLWVYQRRLHSNLVHDLKPLTGADAQAIAERIGGLIDGLYLRFALNPAGLNGESATALVLEALDHEIGAAT